MDNIVSFLDPSFCRNFMDLWMYGEEDDVERTDDEGMTVTLGLVAGDEYQYLKYLIEHYVVDLNTISNDGRSPLLLAASFLIYNFLLDDGAERSGVDDFGRTALMHYAYAAHFQFVEYCVRKEQFQLDAKDDEGKTALHWACARNNNGKTIQRLLQAAPATSKIPDENGATPQDACVRRTSHKHTNEQYTHTSHTHRQCMPLSPGQCYLKLYC